MAAMLSMLLTFLFPAQAAEMPQPEPSPTPAVSQTVQPPPLARLTLDPSMLKRARGWHSAARAGGIVLVGGAATVVGGTAYYIGQAWDGDPSEVGGFIALAGLPLMVGGLLTYTLSTAVSTKWLRRAGVKLSKVPILVALVSLGASVVTLGTLGTVGIPLAVVMASVQFFKNERALKRHPAVSVVPLIDRHTRGLALAMRF
ncbi:MAG: hypothetical protein KTR31_25845 [Myxococcales bacterium]|nr:hypothetical protein [Myxococcales bacterium]